jgi:hypothetical protein
MITLTFDTWEEYDAALAGIVSLEVALVEKN